MWFLPYSEKEMKKVDSRCYSRMQLIWSPYEQLNLNKTFTIIWLIAGLNHACKDKAHEQRMKLHPDKQLLTLALSSASSRSAFCWLCDVSPRWSASENISPEIPTGEKGGRRGVLLPGQERRGARAVSPPDDGSLWVSERLSQCFLGASLWPHVEEQNPGFRSNRRVCRNTSGLSVTHTLQNQSPGLQTLLISFTDF